MLSVVLLLSMFIEHTPVKLVIHCFLYIYQRLHELQYVILQPCQQTEYQEEEVYYPICFWASLQVES